MSGLSASVTGFPLGLRGARDNGPAVHPAIATMLAIVAAVLGGLAAGPGFLSYPLATIPWMLFGAGLVVAGAVMTGESGPNRRTGHLLVFAGLLWPTGWTGSWGGGPAPIIEVFGGPCVLVLSIAAMCRYPDPRLVTKAEKLFLVLMGVWVPGGRVAIVLTGRPEWMSYPSDSWWPSGWSNHAAWSVISQSAQSVEVLLGVAFIVLWVRRARSLRGLQRKLARPVVVAGVMTGLATAATQLAVVLNASSQAMVAVYGVQSTLLLAVPVALILAVIRGRLSAAAVGSLVNDFARGVTPWQVEAVLRRTLGDDTLRVFFWSRTRQQYVDSRGLCSPLLVEPDRWSGDSSRGPESRVVLPVHSSAGEPLAVIETRRGIAGQADLIGSAVAASGIALENAQLQIELQAQLAAVQAAQQRVTEAGIRERQQMERDLHDGAQQRLLAVKMTLAAAEAQAETVAVADLVSRARDQVGEALDELRDLARGLHPPLLSQAGLAAAVTAMTESLPIEASVDLPRGRFPIATELTAYFVLSEGLANVVRHSGAESVTVTGHTRGDYLFVILRDDGCGGADQRGGTGLSGLQDRVSALGGALDVHSPIGEGTTMTLELPCRG